MKKLLDAYRADPTLKNAQKIREYNLKHPMAVCMLSVEEHKLLVEVVAYAQFVGAL